MGNGTTPSRAGAEAATTRAMFIHLSIPNSLFAPAATSDPAPRHGKLSKTREPRAVVLTRRHASLTAHGVAAAATWVEAARRLPMAPTERREQLRNMRELEKWYSW